MSERDLSGEWARSQLEAWADGSLTGESRERMAAALAADAKLRAAAERAIAVRRALRELRPVSMPAGLRRRLLTIPGPSAWVSFARPAVAGIAVAVVAATVWWNSTAPPPVDERRVAAMHDFETAMRYLKKSARITQGEVTDAVGSGFRDAIAVSREALDTATDETGG